jgi:hypothetical protein
MISIFRLAPVSKPPPEVMEKPEVSKKLRQLDGYVGFANMPNQVYRFVAHKYSLFINKPTYVKNLV